MNLGTQIAQLRKATGITQEQLAQKLGVTNQAVSKWESGQSCPDISLLPAIADQFDCSIDALFERASPVQKITDLPWPEDEKLRIVIYNGHSLVGASEAAKELTMQYEGPARDVECAINLHCQNVGGNVHAGGGVTCDMVGGSIHAGGNVTCDCVSGDARAGGNITCDEICGSANAGGNIFCDEMNMESGGRTIHIHYSAKD